MASTNCKFPAGTWRLIQMTLIGKRLSFENQPSWNSLQGPALVRASLRALQKQRRAGPEVAHCGSGGSYSGDRLKAAPQGFLSSHSLRR